MEKRTYIRQAIELDARVVLSSRAIYPGRLKDFCLGGLFLEFDSQRSDTIPLQVDERVEVSFALPAPAGGALEYRVDCRVAGLFRGGMGLEFIEPPPEVLVALQNQASKSRKSRPDDASIHEPTAGTAAAAALDACRARSMDFQEQQIKTFFKKLEDGLFLAARDAENNVEQAQHFDALKEVGQIKEPFSSTFTAEMNMRLHHPGQSFDKPQQSLAQTDSMELKLVDTKEFNDLLSIKKMLERVGPSLEDRMYDLNKRVGKVVGRDIDDSDNPFGPISICSVFHESLQNLAMSKVTRRALYDGFEQNVVNELGALYDELNGILIEQGILPVVERPDYSMPRKARPKPAKPPVEAQAGVAPEESEALQDPLWNTPASPGSSAPTAADAAAAGAGPAPSPAPAYTAPPQPRAPIQPGQPAVAAGGAQAAPAAAGGNVPVYINSPYGPLPSAATVDASAQVPAPMPAAAPAAAPVQFATNALQTARSLFRLNRGGSAAVQAGTGQTTGSPADYYPAAEVLDALSSLRADTPNEAIQPGELKQRLQEKLAELSDGSEQKQIGEPESDAIDIIARLVRSILSDALVANGAKQRLAGMEAPLTRLVLQDESFLVNEAHPARQVINQLGRLDLPREAQTGSPDEQMCQQVDKLIGRISSEYTRGSSVFDDAVEELDQMVEQQARIYQENLQETVEACKQAQTIKRKRIGGDHKHTSDLHKNLPPEMRQATDRVMRLKVGDILGFQSGGEISREVLAWIADDRNTYIFVDFKGRKSSTKIAQELAIALQRGSAVLLSESDLPTMERGLYSIFNDLQKDLAYHAIHDPLTGLFNGRRFQEQLEETLARTRQEHTRHCLCILELDDYPRLVEMSSETAGNSLIKRLGQVLEKQLATRGYVARLEESRFAAVLLNCEVEEGLHIVERQRESIQQSRVVWKGEALPVSISIGLRPLCDLSTDAETETAAAMAACAQAMQAGGNRSQVVAGEGESPQPSLPRVDWASVVPEILEQGRLRLYSQSIMPVTESGSKPLHEVVMRVEEQGGGLVEPDAFVRGAEQAGLMPSVDRWVLRKTLQWMAENRRGLSRVAGYAVKLTEATLSDKSLLEFIMGLFTETGVPPGKVLLQVTEATASDQLSAAAGSIDVLREYGSRFCLNNFGTGDSTYSYLKQLPVDYIKVDSLFVRDIAANPQDAAVVRSIVEVGHLMQKQIIADHADNSAACELLEELGVDYVQGEIFGAATPIGQSIA